MKKSLWLVLLLSVTAVISLPIAFTIINNQKESIVITEEVLAGNPKAAEGVTLEFLTQWDAKLLWNTKYTIGSGKTESAFDFEGDGVTWPQEESEYVDFQVTSNFGTAKAVGMRASSNVGVDLEEMWLSEVLKDVAERTKAGETHVETVDFDEFYEFYPIELQMLCEERDFSYYDDNTGNYFSRYFRILVQPEEKLTVSITKDADGIVTAVDCKSNEGGLALETAYVYGEQGCFFTYVCTDEETGERIKVGENTGIFYLPYKMENRRLTIAPWDIEKVCEIPEDIVPAQMLWDEEKGELYLAASAGNEYRLYIYSVNEGMVALREEFAVLVREEMPYYREMTQEEGGILMKWSDGSFSFVAEKDEDYELWCSDVFLVDTTYLEALSVQANQAIEAGSRNSAEIFAYEHAFVFDGERLILAAYDSWDSVNVTLAVYNQEGQLYLGRYRHSAELDMHMSGVDRWIYAQGANVGSNRRRLVEYEPLKVMIE